MNIDVADQDYVGDPALVSDNGAAPPAEMADPEAPYGRKADGTPKAKPGRRPTGGGQRPPAAPRKATVRPPTKSSGGRRSTRSAPVAVDYAAGVTMLVQLVAVPVTLVARVKPEYAYDAATLAHFAPVAGEVGNRLAQQEPRIAALLDKVLQVGPYGETIALAIAITAQFAVNHKRIPLEVGMAMGAVDPDSLLGTAE